MVSCKRLLKSHRFKRFYDGLEKIYDFRMRGKVKHRLSDCLIVIILATMSGCNIFRELSDHKLDLALACLGATILGCLSPVNGFIMAKAI